MNSAKTTRFLTNAVLGLAAVYFMYILSDPFQPLVNMLIYLLIPAIFGGYLYYAFRPVKRWLTKHTHKPKLASILSVLLFFVILGFLLFFVVKVVVEQAGDLAGSLDFSNLKTSDIPFFDQIEQYLPTENIANDAIAWLKENLVHISRQLPELFSSVGNLGSQILLSFLCFFYLMKDDERIKNHLNRFMEKQEEGIEREQREATSKIDQTLATYINGQMLIAIILGALMYIGYLIIGIPYSFLLAVIALVTNLIPFVGPIIGTIPAVIVALTISFPMVLKTLVAAIVIQQIESDIVTPFIMGSKLSIHPFTVIVVVLVSINLFGVVGALIATPMYLSLKIIVQYVIRVRRMKRMDTLA